MTHYRLLGFVISIIALILAFLWFDWKLVLVLWLALWANNLHLAGRLGYRPDFLKEEE